MRSFVLALTCCVTLSAAAMAQNHTGIMAMSGWAKASAPGANVGVAYATLMNHSDKTVEVTALSSPVAKAVELHDQSQKDGVMTMRRVEVPRLAPGGAMQLKPGGRHFMLIGLNAPLTEGQTFPLIITFDTGESVTAEITVKKPGLQPADESPKQGHDHHHHH
jgi:copper(I)-binding protein